MMMPGSFNPQRSSFKFVCRQDRFLWPKCSLCGLKVPSNGFSCEKCTKETSFTYEAQLYVHMRDVHKIPIPSIIICELCDENFSDTDKLLEHILVEKHSCFSEHLPCAKSTGNCLALFESQDDLDDHIKSKHRDVETSAGVFASNANQSSNVGANGNTNFIMHTAPFVSVNLNSNFVPPHGNNPLNSQQGYNNYLNYYNNQNRVYSNPLQGFQPPQNQYQFGTTYPQYSMPQHQIPNQSTAFKMPPFNPKVSDISLYSKPVNAPRFEPPKTDFKAELKPTFNTNRAPVASFSEVVQKFEKVNSTRSCYLCEVSFPHSVIRKTAVKCVNCGKWFLSMRDVISHMLDFHKEQGPIPPKLANANAVCGQPGCLLADSPLKIGVYLEHMKNYHTLSSSSCKFHHICEHCHQLFGSHGSLSGHSGVGLKCAETLDPACAELLLCGKCGHLCSPYGFTKCSFCQNKIADEREALFHIQEKHTGVVAKFKQFAKLPAFSTKCPVHFFCAKRGCRRVFGEINAVWEHQKTCNFDMQKYLTGHRLKQQQGALASFPEKERAHAEADAPASIFVPEPSGPVTVPDETSFECSLCGFLEIVEEKSLHSCKFCSANFLTSNDVKIHMALDHEGLMSIQDGSKVSCDIESCNPGSSKDQQFSTVKDLIKHRTEKHKNHSRCLLHYLCLDNSCGRLFGSRLLLKSHESAKYIINIGQNESSAPLFCPECLKTCDKSEMHACNVCHLNVAGDVDMLYHMSKAHPKSFDSVHLYRFHCNIGHCNDYFNLSEFVTHRKSKHRICHEHYACLRKNCDAQLFSSSKSYVEHESKCLSPRSSKTPQKANNSKTEGFSEPQSKKSKKDETARFANDQTTSKSCLPVKEKDGHQTGSADGKTQVSSVGASSSSKSWDDVMDKMLSYTNSLM